MDFRLGENKGAGQLHAVTAQLKSTIIFATLTVPIPRCSQIRNSMLLAIFFVVAQTGLSNLVGNPEDLFSRVAAHLILSLTSTLFRIYRLML